ncbi:MAG: hypothetical protein M1816_002468 [Peltula sp. TS41687]|nr:MAG: hypothetical protein M1816_002468 [Peltula sp. TS41687]
MRINPTNDHEEIIYTKPTAPYATGSGQCHIHVNGFQDCSIDTKDLSVEVTMWDIAGNQIGYVEATKADATNLLSMESKLESFLVITPEHWGDYIQFSLGAESWTSRDNDNASGAYCNTGSWDPRDGPLCNEESLWSGKWTATFNVLGTGVRHLMALR